MEKDIKLIVSDMDGTLLQPGGVLDQRFFDLYEKMKERKIVFCAASGRQYYNLISIFDKIKDEIYFIAENGTLVRFKEQELLVSDIEKRFLGQIIDEVRAIERAYPVLCGKRSAYIERRDNPDFEEFAAQGAKYYNRCEVVDDLKMIVDDEILKVAVFDFVGSTENCWKYLEHFNDQLKVVISGPFWLDISAKIANKGVGLELVQKRLGVSADQTMIFGDQMNDYEMMTLGKYSYAVENAVDQVKAVANFRAKANTQNGVIEVLEQLLG